MKKILILSMLPLFGLLLIAKSTTVKNYMVKITNTMSYLDIKSSGQSIRIERIQDVDSILSDDFTKTSRACPPFCIQPTHINKEIKNIAELELLSFVQSKVSAQTGLLVDTRLKSWFELESIPSAVNIPYTHISKKLLVILGMVEKKDGTWDGSNAKELALFDNGAWCKQATHFTNNLLKYNYPKNKIRYYRSGLQGWKLLGFTTVVHKVIEVH